jgi:hypothetical protein
MEQFFYLLSKSRYEIQLDKNKNCVVTGKGGSFLLKDHNRVMEDTSMTLRPNSQNNV